jgi:hypothetical protein
MEEMNAKLGRVDRYEGCDFGKPLTKQGLNRWRFFQRQRALENRNVDAFRRKGKQKSTEKLKGKMR